MKPHKHAELIKAWADGAVIERFWNGTHEKAWLIDNQPMWEEWEEYRIKPEQKPDHIEYYQLLLGDNEAYRVQERYANFKVIWDGETRKLKSAEVLK